MNMQERIAYQRRVNSFTQAGMARALGIARQTYIDIETGKTEPRVMMMIELSKMFRCNLNWLITGEMAAPASFADVLQKKLDEMQLILSKGE